MRRGRITGEMPGIEATEEKLMELMALDRRQGKARMSSTAEQGAAQAASISRAC